MKTKLLLGTLAVGSVLALYSTAALAAPPPPPPNFQFGITIGPDHLPPPHVHDDGDNFDDECLSLREIFSDLSDQGYYKFKGYQDADDDFFTVKARRGSRSYLLVVDNCTGDILKRKRLAF
jgi:hypothetical protein